jgi:rhodanese-related sulfurtransferase
VHGAEVEASRPRGRLRAGDVDNPGHAAFDDGMGKAVSPRGDMPKHRVPPAKGRTMSSVTTITVEKLARLVGTPKCPAVVDVRAEEDFAADPRLIPGAVRRPHDAAPAWAGELPGGSAVVVCRGGRKLGEGVAAWLRHEGVPAEALAGGFEAWAGAGQPLGCPSRSCRCLTRGAARSG